MRDRGTYSYPYLSGDAMQTIVETGPLGTAVRVHDRPEYTAAQARTVCRWVNGMDDPLDFMTPRTLDERDPIYIQSKRHDRVPTRKGLVPLPDSK